MALSKEAFTKYPWQDVVQDRENQFSCWSFCNPLGDRMRQLVDGGDATGVEFYYLLWSLASMTLDSSSPKKPLLAMECGRTPTFLDIPEEHLNVLAEVVSDIRIKSAFMRARIADVLWLRNRGHQFAHIAHESYLATIDVNMTHTSVYAKDRIIRALQLALELKHSSLLDTTVQIAEQIMQKYFEDRRLGIWTALDLYLFLVTNNEKDPGEFTDLISDEIRAAEAQGDTTRAENLREQQIKLYHAAGAKKQENNMRLDTVCTLVMFAQEEAERGDFSSAHSKIERAISQLRKVGGRREKINELHKLLHEYGRKSLVNFVWHSSQSSTSKDELRKLNVMTANFLEKIEGKPLHCALKTLARFSESPSTKQVQDLISRMGREFVMQKCVSWGNTDDFGKVISRDSPIQSLCAHLGLHRGLTYLFLIAPTIEELASVHEATLDDLVSILNDCQFVPHDRQQIFARGLLAGLQSDFMLVAHLLPPQLEHAFRMMLVASGEITSKLTPEMIEEEYPLGTIVRNGKLKEILGEDMIQDLICLLVKSPGSLNLRNRLSHGLLPDTSFLPFQPGHPLGLNSDIMYLWWLTLKLCFQLEYQQPDC